MSEPQSISTGIAGRYATALFELAKESNGLDALERDCDALDTALTDSADFAEFISSPVHTRAEQEDAIAAIADALGLGPTVANTLRLMAQKRRLFILPALIRALRERIAEQKGEMTAEVTSAAPLGEDQKAKLSETLKASVGKDVKLSLSVDESLIGGLVVKVGSQMIDTSIRSKLAALQSTMKEVG